MTSWSTVHFGPGASIEPAGKPNLVATPAPPRDSMPGSGGQILTPDRIAIKLPAPESAEEWKADDDERKLMLAPTNDLKRLDTEGRRLDHDEKAVATAEASHARAREAVIAQRVYGRPAAKSEEALSKAEANLAKARRDRGIAAEVVAVLRAQIIEQVRADLAATARAKLSVAHQLYDDSLAALAQTSALLDAMRTAREAEVQAAAQLASALAVVPSPVNGKRAESATGSAYRTIGADLDRVVLMVDQQPDPIRLEGGAIGGYLARRSDASA